MSLIWSPDYAPVDGDFADVSLLLKGEGTNGSTTILDSSSNNLSVTAVDNAQISTAVNTPFGTSDGVLAFDGTDDYLQAAESNSNLTFGTGDFTVEFFIYYNSTNTPILLLDWRNSVGGQDRIVVYHTGGNLTLFNPDNSTTTIFTPNTNIWYHVALCRSSGTLRAYVDGIQVFSVANTVNYLPPGSTNGIYIGAGGFLPGLFFNGYISNFRITKGVARYTENFDVPTAPFPILSPSTRIEVGDGFDVEAANYILAVEAADTAAGQSGGLEPAVRTAINDFVVGCKSDGIWNAIKASCILAGARTTNGALVPLKGTAPTPFNFDLVTDTDYDRELGLLGNASNKYLASNYAFPTSLQNNCHIGGYFSVVDTTGIVVGGYGDVSAQGSSLSARSARLYQTSSVTFVPSDTTSTGFRGVSRNNSANYLYRRAGSNETANIASLAVTHENQGIFARRRNTGSYDGFSDGRLAFYSIGEALDLALLDTRISDFITAIGAAIP